MKIQLIKTKEIKLHNIPAIIKLYSNHTNFFFIKIINANNFETNMRFETYFKALNYYVKQNEKVS